ncbi:hypothetical protein HG530_013614 [Fusarium avenaceum]|nr:hypothetical protein HG530_013614 [Fusarium avenaceum]
MWFRVTDFFGLLLDVVLDTTLASLSLGTELVVLGFLLLVTGKVGDSTSNGTLGTLADTRAEVTELTLGLLVSSLKVLLTAGLLQGLSHILLGRASGLVPGALSTVRIIAGSSSRARECGTGKLGCSMRSVVLSLSLLLLEIAGSLVAGVASDAANSVLDSTSGGVDDGLESGGLSVRHVDRVFGLIWV